MSARNQPLNKALRRQQRAARHARAARGMDRRGKAIPFHGVMVTRGLVKRHRYLQDHGLPFSKSVANVIIPDDIGGITDDEAVVILNGN